MTDAATEFVQDHSKEPVSARTGLANGLEIILPDGTWVNVPIVSESSLTIDYSVDLSQLTLTGIPEEVPLGLPRRPDWYGTATSSGILATSIGTLRADRLSVSLFKACTYFAQKVECKFCAIQNRGTGEITLKDPTAVAEVVRAAYFDPVAPTDHLYFNLGNTRYTERGLPSYGALMDAIRQHLGSPPTQVHLNQTAPRTAAYLQELKNFGFTEVSFNLEVFDEAIASWLIPGKYAEIGLAHHLDMLEAAVTTFGPNNVHSCLIVGLEPSDSTVKGVRALMERGVVPKLSVFRPLPGSQLQPESHQNYRFSPKS